MFKQNNMLNLEIEQKDVVLLWLVELQFNLNSGLFHWSDEEIESFIDQGIIKETPVGYMPTKSVFPAKPVEKSKKSPKKARKKDLRASIKEWINDYRELFMDAKNGNKGAKGVCVEKMNTFMNEHPEYSKDDIMKATERYIADCVQNDVYARYPQYFIYKTSEGYRSSELLDWCESNDEEDTYFDNSDLI